MAQPREYQTLQGFIQCRDQAWSFVQSQAYLRVQTRGGAIVLVGSRWGSDDPHGRQRKESAGSRRAPVVLSYPLKAKPGDRMGRAPGQYLLPGFTAEGEADTRVELGARLAAAVLDCEPIDDAGSTFKPTFFSRTYAGNPADVARICEWHVLALDGAETAGAGDWSVLTWVGRRQGAYLKLGQWRQQVELPELLALVRGVIAQVKPNATLIEAKSSGKAVYQTLSREIPGLVAVQKSRGKRDCYLAASPVFEGGSWLMPATAQPWQQGYTERMTAVTGLKDGEVDDEADADVMVVLWDQERQAKDNAPTAGGLLALLRGGR
jgi:predicted phage terminase large subunit-like protein